VRYTTRKYTKCRVNCFLALKHTLKSNVANNSLDWCRTFAEIASGHQFLYTSVNWAGLYEHSLIAQPFTGGRVGTVKHFLFDFNLCILSNTLCLFFSAAQFLWFCKGLPWFARSQFWITFTAGAFGCNWDKRR